LPESATWSRVLTAAVRWLFALLLAVSGVAKLADMTGFYAIVADYRMLPAWTIPLAAWLLALGELGLALWLALGRRLRVGALAVVLLHALYLVWLLVALARGLQLANCGCFGVFWARPLEWYSPLEDLALMLIAAWFWRQQAARA
jgi:uncharacterized membrane protein YphA (DoxX/SURF4 family)